MSENTCRICLNRVIKECFTLESTSKTLQLTYAKIYQYVCGLEPINEPKFLCLACEGTLSTAYRFRKRLEENERILTATHIKTDSDDETDISLKPEMIVFESEILTTDIVKEEEEEINSFSSPQPSDDVSDDESICESNNKSKESRKQEVIQCPLCAYKGCEKSNFRKHVKRVHNNQKLKCDGCSSSFHLIYVLLEHRKEKHRFEHEYKVDEPTNEKTKEKETVSLKSCQYCDCTFSSYKLLKQHCNTEHPDKKYGCPDCEERFALAYHLKKHRRQVHNFQPENVTTICGYCGKLFPQKSLDSHIRNIHFKPDTEYTCDLCNIKISTKPGLINHMRSKHMDVVYNCRHCPESFPNYSCRRTHEVRFHTFDYRFICNFCPKKFMERVQLRKHIATHTGERRYRCEICAMAFITLTNLKLHLASHSDERPFPCQICKAAFKTKMALRKHHRTHEERNYECPVCFQRYLVNQQLRIHITRNHPEYDLPPPGTVMNKSALKRINAVTEKYNVQVSPSVGLSSRKSNF